jgi:predicted HD phosphohydrolase
VTDITPPPELVQQWSDIALTASGMFEVKMQFATLAAQWGADQELEACCELLDNLGGDGGMIRRYRRPKPLSLKEQALEQLDGIATVFRASHGGDLVCDTIRRALEALPE